MTKKDILNMYQTKIYAAILPLRGSKLDKHNIDLLRATVQEAALSTYKSIPMAYRDMYRLYPPVLESIDIVVNGPELTIQWKKPLVPDDLENEGNYGSDGSGG